MQREVVDGVLAGQYYYFPDAVNPEPVPPYPVPITEREILELRIMGATGHDHYTERLAGTDLSRVLYVYGVEDMIVGRLTDDEVGFLTSRGSRILAVQGGHVSMFEDPEVARQIATALAESEGSGTRGCFDTQCPRPSIRCHVRGAGSYCQIWRAYSVSDLVRKAIEQHLISYLHDRYFPLSDR